MFQVRLLDSGLSDWSHSTLSWSSASIPYASNVEWPQCPPNAWVSGIGDAMPRKIGDIGFPVVLDPVNPDIAYVFPMDGQSVWPRTSIGGKPAAYVTRNGGKSWQRLDRGLPRSQAWLTVLRQGMCADSHENLGLYFGTTGGELWGSANAGESWYAIARHLPEIYSVTHAL